MTMHGQTGVRVLQIESQLALEHADEPTAVLLARYREILLAPFDALREDYEALDDARVAQHLDELLRAARGVPMHVAQRRPRSIPQQVLDQAAQLTDLERKALAEALLRRDAPEDE